MRYHCQEYEELTIEEKLLVDAGMREWFENSNPSELCMPTIIFDSAERIVIKRLKKGKYDKRNRKQGASRTNNKQSHTRSGVQI